jgi:leader peptidase (prepilin peptidase)/N-methyltransferase
MLLKSFVFSSVLILLALCDLDRRLLPHGLNNAFIIFAVLFSVFQLVREGAELLGLINAFFLVGALLLSICLVFPEGIGGGDIKLAAGLALWVVPSKIFLALGLSFGLAIFWALLVKVVNSRAKFVRVFPLAPFLAIGCFIAWHVH